MGFNEHPPQLVTEVLGMRWTMSVFSILSIHEIMIMRKQKKKLDLETDLDTVASVTSIDPRLTFDPIK